MCAAWATVRLFGLESGYPAVALMTYTLYVLMVAVVATILALGLREWAAAALAALALIALGAVIAPRAIGGAPPLPGGSGPGVCSHGFRGGGARGPAPPF